MAQDMTFSVVPRVTVLMAVYNGEPFLAEAMQSILDQTFTDFEFLIIDDGSTDKTVAVIEGFCDFRIRLIRNTKNCGLVDSLNLGLELARGEYIVRMDADDISLPLRLERQVDFMDQNPEVGVCGSWLEAFHDTSVAVWSPPLFDAEIKASLLFESVLYHPTVIIRYSMFPGFLFKYDKEYQNAEDYELWCRLSPLCRFANIGEVFLKYRLHDKSIGKSRSDIQKNLAAKVRKRFLKELKIEPTVEELALHESISLWRIDPNSYFLKRAHEWLLVLQHANKQQNWVSQQVMEKILGKRWHEICVLATPLGIEACRFYYRSPLCDLMTLPLHHHLVFIVRALLHRT
jgi:glycosyltransferase involved in cell wall biosynthesis